MELIITFLESNLLSALVSAVVSGLIAIIGIRLSYKLSVSETQKAMEYFKSQLTKKVYASSKRSDVEYEIFHTLGSICGEIHLVMERFYPGKMSSLLLNSTEKPTLKELADKIQELDIELNIHRAFIPKEIVTLFEDLIKDAEQFFVDAEKHIDCWDETKDDKNRKEKLRCAAYEKRLAFFEKWKSSSTKCLEYLQSKELV